MTRSEIYGAVFSQNVRRADLDDALAKLLVKDLASFTKEATGGRSTQRWRASNGGGR
jgi:hypothetical protein